MCRAVHVEYLEKKTLLPNPNICLQLWKNWKWSYRPLNSGSIYFCAFLPSSNFPGLTNLATQKGQKLQFPALPPGAGSKTESIHIGCIKRLTIYCILDRWTHHHRSWNEDVFSYKLCLVTQIMFFTWNRCGWIQTSKPSWVNFCTHMCPLTRWQLAV